MFLFKKVLSNDEIVLKLIRTADANPVRNWVPTYYFSICSAKDGSELGDCDLRIGHNENTWYGGNVGYAINPEHRGHHYAAKACLLLFELAKLHKLTYLYITCNPDNIASRKTCEYAGGVLETIADLPAYNDMYILGERQKCIYKFIL